MTVTRQIVFQFIDTKAGATGLTPTVDAWRLSDGTQVLTAAAMTEELGRGLYRYAHTTADEDEEYVYSAHTTDSGVDQQDIAGIDWTARIADGVWDELRSGHNTALTFGALMQLLALSSEVSIFTSMVEAIKVTADVSVSTLGNIDSLIPGTTRAFNVTIKRSGIVQDITGDAVTYRVKDNIEDSDANALLTKTADVTTHGALGIAAFALTPTDTALAPTRDGEYHHDIVWVTAAGAEYVIYSSDLTVSQRVSDV